MGPFGAASEQGSDAWSLVHHQPGGSGAHRLFPAIRDRDAASAIDQASTAAHQRATGVGRVVTTGTPQIRAGSLVELAGTGTPDGTYRVRRARHRIDDGGLQSNLELELAS